MMVRKRHVFFIAGFDPYDVGGLYRRFTREAAVCAKTWASPAYSDGRIYVKDDTHVTALALTE